MRRKKYSEAILEAIDQLMELDPRIYLMGLGVPDAKGIFGTTTGLAQKYGPARVLDMPTSENAMTGIAIGSALMGMRPIMTHQRVDFFLLALDQLINNGAKWHYMFGGKMGAPLVIRLIIGRGWGQGPQHSQTLQALFAHIPGLKVVMPSNPYDAKGLLVAALEEDNPVIYIEHRWLHGIDGHVPQEIYRIPLGQAKVVQEGSDVTLVALSHMTLEAFRAIPFLEREGISVELIDVRSLKPLDTKTILRSIQKTGRLVVADPDWKSGGFAGEIVAMAVEEVLGAFKAPPIRITYPDSYTPTSWALANHYYPTSREIASKILTMMGKHESAKQLREEHRRHCMQGPLDVPDPEFTGPF
jgi:pyruvate dehydrogenase E1 component beta subunit